MDIDSLTFICVKRKVALTIPSDIYSAPLTQRSQGTLLTDLQTVRDMEVKGNGHRGEGVDGSPRLWGLICHVVSGAFPIPELSGD